MDWLPSLRAARIRTRSSSWFALRLNVTWLLSEIDPEQPEIAYGLRFAGRGTPELGYVDLRHLARLAGRADTRIERDADFKADKPISVYAERSRAAGRIVEQ